MPLFTATITQSGQPRQLTGSSESEVAAQVAQVARESKAPSLLDTPIMETYSDGSTAQVGTVRDYVVQAAPKPQAKPDQLWQRVRLSPAQWQHCRVRGAELSMSGQAYIRHLIDRDMENNF